MQFEAFPFAAFTEQLDRLSGDRTTPLKDPCMGL
ncbi:hypothetical protein I656_01352 [Geobacillus sp. WSUCF1]|nr:hypothetical protein I656_01352 [Geobacillus sp. WSUCF1]